MVLSCNSWNDLWRSRIESKRFLEESVEVSEFVEIFVLEFIEGLDILIDFCLDLCLNSWVLCKDVTADSCLVSCRVHTRKEESCELVHNFSFRDQIVLFEFLACSDLLLLLDVLL